MQLTTLTNGNI